MGAVLTEEEWRSLIERIAKDLSSPALKDEPLQHYLELALARLWLAMQSPPPAVRYAFADLKELTFADAHARAADLALEARPEWKPDFGPNLSDLVKSVAIEIRALDKALIECRELGRSDDPNLDYLAFGERGVFILPRISGSRPKGKRNQEFERRGLVHHRLVPVTVEGIPVRLYSPSIRGPGMDGGSVDLVSALFDKVRPTFTTSENNADFHVSALSNEVELVAALESQMCELANGKAFMAVVWPELTISPALLSTLQYKLEERALQDDVAQFGFAVAGSWHCTLEHGGMINAAPVLDSFGVPLFKVIKRERYQLKDTETLEAIQPGAELPILMYGSVLIAFGICKDFCERRHPTPYPNLDVDLILVPSFGDAQTMDDHEIAAGNTAMRYAGRCFVVQQFLPNDDQSVWGTVLRPPMVPRGKAVSPVLQNKLLDRSPISCTIS